VVSLQWPVAVLIASAVPLPPEQALVRAGLVVAGGLWQAVLVVTSWAVSRGAAERAAMAESYEALSQYADDLSAGRGGPPSPDALPGTRALHDPNPLMRSDARRHLSDLTAVAERIRTTLPAVAGAATGADAPTGDRRAHLEASASALREIAEALRSRPAARADHLDRARRHVDQDSRRPGPSWSWAAESLHGQLRSAIRIAQRLDDVQPGRGHSTAGRPAMRPPTHDLVVTLRANLGTSSEAGRHALRLAVITGLAAMVAQAGGLPHSYWAPLTALIVLRPDYGSTLYRGLQRAAGTVVGVGLGLATVLLGHLGSAALLAGVGVSLFAAYALLTVNYLFFTVFLTGFVVVLLDLLGIPAGQTAPARLIGTGLGTGLALLAYILWPTWERTKANEKFARLFLAQTRFAALMLSAYSRPGGAELAQARVVKLAARRARSSAEDSADRLGDEPERPPMTHAFAQALVSAGHRLALAGLAVEAAVRARHAELGRAPRPGPDPVQDRLDQLADLVRQSGTQLAEALRRLGPPGPLPPLREVQSQIPADDAGSTALFAATDSLVDALSTTADALRRHLAPPRPDEHPDEHPDAEHPDKEPSAP
jgi:uncharacterized membrane protein YccC